MRLPVFKTVLILWLSGGASALAAPLIDEPVPELRLVSGKVLRDAQAKGYLRHSVLVKHREGAETVAYEEFPAEYREALAQKRPAPDSPVAPRPVSVSPRTPPPVSIVKKRAENSVVPAWPTLSLNTSRVGSAVTTVELHNGADTPMEVRCSTILAETSLGTILTGRQWVAAEVLNMVSNSLGTKQVIAAHASATLNVVFDPLPAGATITQIVLKTPAQ